MDKFKILIASLPHRERPVAEIYCNNMYRVQISQEEDELLIQFYPHPTEKCWAFSYEQVVQVLEQAKRKLLGL